MVCVFSSIFNKTKQEALVGDLKIEIQGSLKIPYWIYFNGAKHDINSQIADYCCWAISIKWTRDEQRPYNLIKNLIFSEEEIFGIDGKDYY
jgi:predicted transcriptional regulator